VQVNAFQQNRFPAGVLQSVSVNDKGGMVGIYSNSRTIDLAQIRLANFNGIERLKRIDGGAFAATDESGSPTYNALGKDALLALQGEGDPAEQGRRAVKRGRIALDALHALKVEVLAGTLNPSALARLKSGHRQPPRQFERWRPRLNAGRDRASP
jgi:class II flagellar assembly regulator FliX